MSALGQYLEEEGVPAVSVSLIREHTAALRPPRALWVPFMLGRPFGAPNRPDLQRRVLARALRLLEAEAGPVLEDFPEDAPAEDPQLAMEGLACPVSFPEKEAEGSVAARLAREVTQLAAWHAVSLQRRGRSTFGSAGASPAVLAQYVAGWLGEAPPVPWRADLAPLTALKLACDDLKAFYYESRTAQPGSHSPDSLQHWFWMQTSAGEAMLALFRRISQRKDDPALAQFARVGLVPRTVQLSLRSAPGPRNDR